MSKALCSHMSWYKTLLFPTILVAVAMFMLEFALHGIWLTPLYEETAQLWRPESEMQPSFLSIARLLAFSFLITVFYYQSVPGMQRMCSKDGQPASRYQCMLCFAITIGLFLALEMSSSYLWMPISGELAIKWAIVGFIQGIVAGFVIFAVDRGRKASEGASNG